MDTDFAIRLLGALFAIMNPFVNLPVFLGVTTGMSVSEQRAVAVKVAINTAVMGTIIALVGSQVLALFGISTDDFRVAGGLVLLLIALGMLNGRDSSAHHGTAGEKEDFADRDAVAFYPMTFPIIVGPGTITTLIVFSHEAKGIANEVTFAVVFFGLVALLGVVLFFASSIGAHLSATSRVIMTRLMGMILAAISVDMIATGLRTLLPGLAGGS